MGHRKSHSRVSKREKTDAHDEDKDSRRERKRKRERKEAACKKRHREKERGSKNSHPHRSKSSAKRKTKDRRVTRQKAHERSETSSSDSYNSSSSESSKRHGRYHHSRRRNEEQTTKRSRKDDEMVRMSDKRHSYDAQSELRHHSEEALGSEVTESHVSRPEDGPVARSQEQEMGINGKESLLEVELRQRALANFMRHRGTSSKMEESKEGLPLAVQDISEKNRESVITVDRKWASCLSDLGARIDKQESALITGDKDLHSHLVEGTAFKHACDDALEEGEIDCHMVEPASVNMSSLLTEDYVSVGKEGYKLTPSGLLEQKNTTPHAELGVAPFAEDSILVTDDKRQEHASDVGPATAGQDGKPGFQTKTMSVMRGGEMVQVTYNVYIPKRAAELARRRLQR